MNTTGRILIIGGTGLLGRPVAKKLKDAGCIVRLLVRDIARVHNYSHEDFELVEGNVNRIDSLVKAMQDCIGVHVNLSGNHEYTGVVNIVRAAEQADINRITYISGTSVAEENIWVPIIKRKFLAEKAIRDSGLPYTIFCPSWFMEVIPKYIRDGRAVVFGKQPNVYHFIAADDYASMVARSYSIEEAINKRFVIHGPEGILFTEAVDRYRQARHPEIRKVMNMPYWLATIISMIKRRPEMKAISDWMKSFEKIGELGDPSEANAMLGAPKITLEKWINNI